MISDGVPQHTGYHIKNTVEEIELGRSVHVAAKHGLIVYGKCDEPCKYLLLLIATNEFGCHEIYCIRKNNLCSV